jgi:hypothetical protein
MPTMTARPEDEVTSDPVLEAFDRAPIGEPYSAAQRAELDQIVADIAAGKVATVPHAEVHAWVTLHADEDAEFAAE